MMVGSGGGHTSFEDKRRENYEKGQAELERRRQIILEQQRREQQERERKEREELQRKEKMRQEQERKRQEELNAERERQRLRAEELEKERQRLQEQKEAARREMERQKELELQKQRIIELSAIKQRTQEGLTLLKRRKLDLCLQVERLSREVGEINGKVAAHKEDVARAKGFIDGMRPQRDEIMVELSAVKLQLKDCSDRTLLLNQEKLNMQNQLASLKSKAGNKKRELETKIEMARKQLQQLNNDIKSRTLDVEKVEKEVEDKENLKNAQNNVDDSVWGGVPAVQQTTAVPVSSGDSIKPQWEDPTAVDWGDEIEQSNSTTATLAEVNNVAVLTTKPAGPAVPPLPTQATMDAWGNSTLKDSRLAETVSEEKTAQNQVQAENNEVHGNDLTNSTTAGLTSKSEKRYRALYEFEARNDDELSFLPGDIINAVVGGAQGEPGWLTGELRGQTGWFPESYVESFEAVSDGQERAVGSSLASCSQTVATVKPILQEDTADENMLSASIAPGQEGEVFYAIYPYESEEPGDLSFPLGAAIRVTARDGDWWTGIYGDASGIFPNNYVSTEKPVYEISELVDKSDAGKTFETKSDTAPSTAVTTDKETSSDALHFNAENEKQPDINQTSKRSNAFSSTRKSMQKKPEIVMVVANYEASGDGQLSLTKGQLVQVRKKTDGGWWEGEIHQKGKGRQSGWFPASYVKVLAASVSAGQTGAEAAVHQTTKAEASPSVTSTEKLEKVRAIFDFQGQRDDELTFVVDDVIVVTSKEDSSWWKGYKINDGPSKEGLFPSNYMEAI